MSCVSNWLIISRHPDFSPHASRRLTAKVSNLVICQYISGKRGGEKKNATREKNKAFSNIFKAKNGKANAVFNSTSLFFSLSHSHFSFCSQSNFPVPPHFSQQITVLSLHFSCPLPLFSSHGLFFPSLFKSNFSTSELPSSPLYHPGLFPSYTHGSRSDR